MAADSASERLRPQWVQAQVLAALVHRGVAPLVEDRKERKVINV